MESLKKQFPSFYFQVAMVTCRAEMLYDLPIGAPLCISHSPVSIAQQDSRDLGTLEISCVNYHKQVCIPAKSTHSLFPTSLSKLKMPGLTMGFSFKSTKAAFLGGVSLG